MKGLQIISTLALHACAAGMAMAAKGSPIELDLVFPNPNIIYAVDSQATYFPIVFAWQGFRPAIYNNNLDFFFGMSLSNSAAPNGTFESPAYFNASNGVEISNSDGSPAYYVGTILLGGNLSDTTIVQGVVNNFTMSVYLNWGDASGLASCASPYYTSVFCNSPCELDTSTTFAIWGGTPKNAPAGMSVAGPMDEMPGVANVCPEPVLNQGWNATATTMCDTYTDRPRPNPTPCAAKPNAADVSSFSSIALANVAYFSSAFEAAGSSDSAAAATQTGSAQTGSAQTTAGASHTGTAASIDSGSAAPKTTSSASLATSSSSRSHAMVTAMPHAAAPALLLGAGVLGGMHLYL